MFKKMIEPEELVFVLDELKKAIMKRIMISDDIDEEDKKEIDIIVDDEIFFLQDDIAEECGLSYFAIKAKMKRGEK